VTAVAAGALYWAFLNTPESSASMLAVSGALLLALFLVVAVGGGATVLRLSGVWWRDALVEGATRLHWFALTAAVAAVLVWGVLRVDTWVAAYAGEISAWFIATFNWSEVSPVFTLERYLSVWLRWVVVPSGMVAALAAALKDGGSSLASASWMRAAWRWQSLAVSTAAFALLVALPWSLADRRPAIPVPVSLEAWAAGGRLLVLGAVMAIGVAIMLDTVARRAMGRRSEG